MPSSLTIDSHIRFMWLQREFEKRSDPKNRQEAALLDEMRAHVKKVHAAYPPDRVSIWCQWLELIVDILHTVSGPSC